MSRTTLRRPVYLHPPREMRLPPGNLLKLNKTLYGLPEAPIHWFKTYGDYHQDKLQMKQDASDPCLWYQHTDVKPSGILVLQVDDTLFTGNTEFLKLEKDSSTEFPNSGRTFISAARTRFNGLDIRRQGKEIHIDQWYYVSQILDFNSRTMTFNEFQSTRQKLAYCAYSSMPDILIYVARMSQYTEKMFLENIKEPTRLMEKCIKVLKEGPSQDGLKYVHLDPENIEVVVAVDAAFAVNPDKTSQIGLIAMLRDKNSKKINIVQFR